MGFFGRLLMGGRHYGQGGGHHDGGYRHGQGGYPPVLIAAGMAYPTCHTANAATARFRQDCDSVLVPLRHTAYNVDLAVGVKFCGTYGMPQQ